MNNVILFSLISRQAMANVIPALQIRPLHTVLFTTHEESNTAMAIVKMLRSNGLSVSLASCVVDAYNGQSVIQAMRAELEQTSSDKIPVLNVTGGTKIMAFAAYQLFLQHGHKIIYCNTADNVIMTLYPTPEQEQIRVTVSLHDYLFVHGYAIENKPQRKLEQDNERFLREAVLPRLNDFENFFDHVRARNPLERFRDQVRKFQFEFRKNDESIELHDERTKLHVAFPASSYQYGRWLEDLTLLKILQECPDDVLSGIKIIFQHGAKNELDVAATLNGKLILVSCKSGKNIDNADIHQLLSLKNLAGGTFGKGYIVLQKKGRYQFSSLAQDVGLTLLTPTTLLQTQFFH